MKAAVLNRQGEAPRLAEFAEPAAGAGETLVEVRAAAIKQLDRAIASGSHYASPKDLPIVCGTDGVGLASDGRRVYFVVRRRSFGSMAERAPAGLTVPLPDGLDDASAAAVVNPSLAAFLPLVWRGRLERGETVLVIGATGASGRMTVRAARLLGAGRVIAAARNQEIMNTLGADATIDLRLPKEELKQAFAREAARGIDLVVDFVWGPAAEALIEALVRPDLIASGGGEIRFVQVGSMGGDAITLNFGALRGARLTLLGSGTGNFPPPERMRSLIAEILERAAKREIGVEVARRPLSEIAEAWTAKEDERRIVLMV